MDKNKNLTAVPHALNLSQRAAHYGHRGAVMWLTGLPASGKSSLSMALEQALTALGYSCYVLDGDNLRKGLNANLGFSPADRTENIRRVGEVAALFADAGLICITAFISPYRADRARARQSCGEAFHEIHISADLATCEARDPKGLYKKARSGELLEFTGVSAPYEIPEQPQLVIDTAHEGIAASVKKLIAYVERHVPLDR
jgi:adenylyl-sulfate kinase